MAADGTLRLVRTGRLRDGFLDDEEFSLVVTGRVSPRP